MKKYIIMATVAVAMLFVSCKNEDIKVSRNVNFKINPYEVISGFDYEVEEGELESFSSDYKLRIHLLVYDESGFLQGTDVQFLTNYQSLMNSTVALTEGKYTAVAISDVVKYDGSSITMNYWDITGTDRLSDLKVADAGYIGGKYKILGISNYDFEVKEGSVDHTIHVKPAGALILRFAWNIHYYNIEEYELDMNKTSDFCTFNNDGTYEVAIENHGGDYDWRLCYFDPKDYSDYNGCYGYYFVLPLGRTSFQWYGKSDNSWYYVGDEMSANIKFGEEYLAYLELGSDIIATMELVNGTKAVSLPVNAKEAVQIQYGNESNVENPQPLK
jgi:hypothetical protein